MHAPWNHLCVLCSGNLIDCKFGEFFCFKDLYAGVGQLWHKNEFPQNLMRIILTLNGFWEQHINYWITMDELCVIRCFDPCMWITRILVITCATNILTIFSTKGDLCLVNLVFNNFALAFAQMTFIIYSIFTSPWHLW